MTRGDPDPVPSPVRAAAALTGIEAAVLSVLCLIYLWAILTGSPGDRASALLGAALGLGLAGLLAALARGLTHRRRVALTPVVVTQLLALPVSWGLYQSGQWFPGIVVAVLAVGVLGLLFGTAQARGTFS